MDQPALAPLLARVSLSLFGVSEAGLRLWPALAAAGTVVVGGMTAREFGGARRAQLLAAVATGTMPVLLGGAHVANTTSYEVLAWAAIAFVVVRIGRTGDTRWWLAAGALVGIGAEFNHLAAIFGVVLLAAVLPDLWWQARHGWAMFEMTRALNGQNGGPENILTWAVGQFGMSCLAMTLLWVAGLRFLWRSGRPLWRCLVTAYAVLFVLFAVTTGAQVYYLGGLYVCLLAAGAVGLDGWLHSRPDQLRGLMIGTAASAAVLAVIVLPVLPPSDVAWTYDISTNGGIPGLAPTGRHRAAGMDRAPARAARQRGDLHGGLRRGRRHQRTRTRYRTAHRRERPQHRLVVGPRQPARHDRSGRRPRPRPRPRVRRPSAPVLPARPRGRHPLQPRRRAQHRMGRPRLHLYRPPPPLGRDVARTAQLRLTPPPTRPERAPFLL